MNGDYTPNPPTPTPAPCPDFYTITPAGEYVCYTTPPTPPPSELPPTGVDDGFVLYVLFVVGMFAVTAGVVFLVDRLTKWWRP